MKKLLLIFCLLFISNGFSQSEKEIKFLDYASIEIAIPDNCSAKSKYELLDCDGISAQWIYFDQEMLKSAFEQFIKKFGEKNKSKEQIAVISFGSTLKGYKFTSKDPEKWNRILVYGTVNNQPLILNVASEDELLGVIKLNEFLKKIMKIKT
ncbi:hypothetical protein [Ulvibacter antarcticus]|uniref:Uncharacterized protein n=1 Tax=Ulvibacter antarcticus TaxID=442714 RepID=A0A3L9YY68_9FLAO|nr:hypothetical protein [Ulvibacter antarcticus]RMA64780.1 hypothetical protein BXY75_1661 [Ulvibacter antarcticus]